MKSKIVFCVSLLMLVQAVATAKVIQVPSRTYQTIQAGINAASNGDIVEVAPNPNPYYPVSYSGPGNVNLDFSIPGFKNITVRSQIDPNNPNWDVINSTIIDCCGIGNLNSSTAKDNGLANRAFRFHSGETAASKVIGFTIKNGYARGPKAANGGFVDSSVWYGIPYRGGTAPWQTSPSWQQAITSNPAIDPCTLPPAALDANDASGDGYGGAILCENSSSPTISYCVIENCTVTGALGGTGATGLSAPWSYYTWADFNWADGNTYHMLLPTATIKNTNDGQWGGRGGSASGTGYGGAIALKTGCSPAISNCHFINNSAQGGQGGDGGAGGNAAGANFDQGLESGGGDAGTSDGNGVGGAIYAASGCSPVITSCHFQGNIAKTGPRGTGGDRGFGNVVVVNNARGVPKGADSRVTAGSDPGIAGGAAYFASGAKPAFTDCNFIDNKAYLAFYYEPLENYPTGAGYPLYLPGFAEDIAGYTAGGAVFFKGSSTGIVINTCDFIDNTGGALYFGPGCGFDINNASAVAKGQPGRKNLFQGNTAPDDVISYAFPSYVVPSSGKGGAIYIDSVCSVNISDAVFNENRAKINGGAIESLSDVTISGCAFSGNIAEGGDNTFTGFGGAVDVYNGAERTINLSNCSFTNNKSVWGGALSTEIFHGDVNNCFFIDNTAQIGGALDLSLGQSTITFANSVFSGNRATSGDGGGIYCSYTSVDINNCEFFNNSAEGTFAYGGGIDIDGAPSPVNSHKIKNCLFVGNSSSYDGGAITCESYVNPQILDCTFSQNTAAQFGGAIFVGWDSNSTIKDCIIQKSNNRAIHEEDAGGNATATYCLFFDNPDGHYYDSGTQHVYNDADISSIPGGSNNLVGDPLFVTGNLGDYYLSQVAAGQLINSPAVDTGDVLASALGLDTRTTATNDIGDSGLVDLGYHFSRAVDMPQFHLTASVVGGIGTISVLPAPLPDGNYYAGTVVTVTAQPQTGWVVKNWTGTDDDSEVATAQKVAMNSNRNVTVEFKQPTTFIVAVGGGNGGYANIAAAMHDANDGDVIVVYPGVYYGPQLQFTKSVEVRSQNPEDPEWVAQVIIDFNEPGGRHAGPIIFFPQGANSGCVLNGFTIRNSNWYTDTGDNGAHPGENGGDGSGGEGGAIWIGPGAGPVIKNCVITGNSVLGGFGGNGANADAVHNAGRGGWGGWARGGAIYCSVNSYPQFINCRILNNRVVGGFGGNGGDIATPGGNANYGGNYSRAEWFNYDPRDLTDEWVPGDLYVRWTEMAPDISYADMPLKGMDNYGWIDDYRAFHWGYIGDYRWYSGYGGGVFINKSSNVTFTNCEISGNLAQGGFSGLGGNEPGAGPARVEPYPTKYEIPAFGGGVYVAAESIVTFTGCTINNNTASDPTFDHTTALGINGTLSGYIPANYNPLNHFSLDSYLGHGGGVCAEDTAKVTFVDCNFNGNKAAVGGGLFGAEVTIKTSDCDFVSNQAHQGGGMFGQNGSVSINRCQFTNNAAPDDLNDPNVLGEGGGLHFWSAQANIADSNITGNSSEAMGGGVYFGGEGSASLRNCLLTNNSAGQFGGAVAATIFAQLKVANCTIVNNVANLGGGLSSSEGGYINVIDSIIWDNRAGLGANGSQIAVSGTEPPAAMQVRYSDVQDSNDPCAWANDINALDFVICFDTTGSMGGDISAVKTAARQITNAIAAQYADYRLALVDFRDYPDGNHGAIGDWAYRDRVKFTTDPNILISGLQPMVAGGGADEPEAIYTALMHSIDANALVARLTANGYTNYIDPNSPGLGDWRKGKKVMRVILVLTDAPPHDPEPYTNYVLNDIITAANSENPIHIIPVVIRGASDAESALRPVAVGTGGTLILATDSNAVSGAVLNAIGLLSQIPAPMFIGPNSTINWNPTTFTWEPNSHNINADPLFVGGYFLSQIAAGQDVNSPCVDKGSADVNSPDINLGGYTTRIDGVNDVGIVDMGYHYSAITPSQYYLTFTALGGLTSANITPSSGYHTWFSRVPLRVTAPVPAGYQVLWTGTSDDNINGVNNSVVMNGDKTVTVAFVRNTCNLMVIWNNGGTVTPTSGTYPRGADVSLTATPDAGYRIESWEGTNNDSLFTRTNTVTMNGDKTVRVTFSVPQTRTVPGEFTTIQEAIEASRSGDIVSVASGVYHGSTIVLNKEIKLTSTYPDDPCGVAETIIDSTGYQGGLALLFTAGATANTVVDGFTIISGTYKRIDAQNATAAGQNGPDGDGIVGGAVYINTGASPTLRNCVIRDTTITGGSAGSGGNADTTTPAGRGGWGGWARGGGVYIAPFANPTLVNCTITNCSVIGGNGGNGGNSSGSVYGAADYQDANHGGLWSNDFSFPWRQMVGADGEPCYIGDYRFYSGYGGGVFCDANSEANFIDCSITNNIASGGMSGIGGTRPEGAFIPDPVTAYRIPSYGGGVYCGANSDINFVGCVISGNVAPRPDATYHRDPYLGHGGGIAFEDTASIRLENCTISDNNSAVGGGMFWSGGEPEVLDCDIMRNTAYLGGGIYATGSAGQIRGCTLGNNFAGVSPNDVDVIAGQGGGIFGSSIDTVIADCFLTDNTSSTSGGGIHIYGPGDADTIISNCLLARNQAGRDGGGISSNWGAVVSVENCTLYNNQATGTFGDVGNTGFGGGLYCAYTASTDINNSIFWDNNGLFGNEIAESTGFEGTQLCGTVSVSYSDIRGGQAGVYISPGCPNDWGGLGNIDADPLFVNAVGNDFHLQQITAGQMVNSPCIDAGGSLAVLLGLFRYSTSTLGTSDTGIVDLGYHYPIADYCRKWDLYVDNIIDFRDFAIFASAWVGDLGYGTDDLKEFTYCWLEELQGDVNAPTPNPMTWAIPPRALTGSSVEMMASTAVDASGRVYYQFEEVNGPSSTWQTDPYYVATGISPTGEYCFRVRARDKYNNTTAWSEPACVSNIGDVNAPTPAPVFVAVAAQNIARTDPNTASGQFEWDTTNYQWDWWHRIIVDVTGVTDDRTPTSELEVRFICSNSTYSSDTVIPAMYRPIRIGHPVAIGGRIPANGGSDAAYGSYRLTWNGANQIVYEVYVEAWGGSYGRQLSWHVCVYDASQNAACTGTHSIPP